MHILLGILGVLSAAMLWYWRAKQAGEAAGELTNAANDVRLAIRRFGYMRKHKVHLADCVDDARLAAAGIVASIAAMDAPLSQAEIDMLTAEAGAVFGVDSREAVDIAAFGRWVAGQCNTPEDAVRRLTKIIRAKAGAEAGPDLIRMVQKVATADGVGLDERETDALQAIRRGLGMA
ncbi:MAG: TerB family tellurite resistance protein [Hyphomicrobiales bacterium]|nr:MAG: TerB family tellurite resistance protein [Hyphomicrobiales bacterium]